jgi:hypothetical protein
MGVGALTAGLLLTAPQPASAANLIRNPGFETAGTDDMPYWRSPAGATTTSPSPPRPTRTAAARP